jgi:hypothetical protein
VSRVAVWCEAAAGRYPQRAYHASSHAVCSGPGLMRSGAAPRKETGSLVSQRTRGRNGPFGSFSGTLAKPTTHVMILSPYRDDNDTTKINNPS